MTLDGSVQEDVQTFKGDSTNNDVELGSIFSSLECRRDTVGGRSGRPCVVRYMVGLNSGKMVTLTLMLGIYVNRSLSVQNCQK